LREVGVVNVTPLMRALIIEAGVERPEEDRAYAGRVMRLLMDQLERASRVELSLAWPSDPTILRICDHLYANPAIDISLQDWAQRLGTSTRTLTRAFEAHLGMTLREWKRKLRLFRSVELLSDGRSMTQIAFELGYSSTSAFIYMFKQEMGVSPRRYREHIGTES
jgi:AraC-like DNA-binding protein